MSQMNKMNSAKGPPVYIPPEIIPVQFLKCVKLPIKGYPKAAIKEWQNMMKQWQNHPNPKRQNYNYEASRLREAVEK